MQIGEIARRAGMSVRAVRYYEELGLLQPDSHSSGGFRLYSEKNLKRLRVIDFLKSLGLSLAEIREILLAKKSSGGNIESVRTLFKIYGERLSQIESQIKALSDMRDEIAQVVTILRSCQSCGRDVLLDAKSCADCANLVARESLPETFEVILS
jgi:MerR family Zn(II)-responsive transcriptional regulator of zntA